MNLWKIATRSFRYYLPTNTAIVLGVAAATAVLTGALIVGHSMRTSLRQLTLQRLGKIDEMLISQGFFSVELAEQLRSDSTFQDQYSDVEPAILFPGGTVESEQNTADGASRIRRGTQITVMGITDRFWDFSSRPLDAQSMSADENQQEVAIINQTVADDLGLTQDMVESGEARITVRIPKQTQLPSDSSLSKKTDLIESLVDLQVIQILPTEGLGRFAMFPSQSDPSNVFVPLTLLQDSLSRTVLKHKASIEQANVLLLSGASDTPPDEVTTLRLRKNLSPSFEDYGLSLKPVKLDFGEGEKQETLFEYWSLSSDKLLLTDEAVASITRRLPNAKPVYTYLANDIRKSGEPSGIPFSMVTGIDVDETFAPVSAISGDPIAPIQDGEIVLNEWAANDLNAKIGDRVTLAYFEPETTHGEQIEQSTEFTLVDIIALTEPDEPFFYSRRKGLEPPKFLERPTLANDADLTPEVPGVTDAATVEDWDLPVDTAGKMRDQDDVYWEFHRTTPKALINLAESQRLWKSRFGETTSFRIPTGDGSRDELVAGLLEQFSADDAELGIHLVPIKRRGLEASAGSTPFDVLFLALSMFVIGAALILVSLLFRLGLQQRASQVGLMKAAGFGQPRLRRVWLTEMLLVSAVGAVLGVALGVVYAGVMIFGLTTWWVGAISRPFLELHVSPLSLVVGLLSGLVICVLTITLSLWRAGSRPVIRLLRGELEAPAKRTPQKTGHSWLAIGLLVLAGGLAIAATQLAGEAQAGAFMGAGFLVLIAGLLGVYRWLKNPGSEKEAQQLSMSRLALLSAKRNPLRSTLTIGLVAVASFLIAAVSSFRLSPTEAGTGGFDWVAQSSQPVFADLATPEGQRTALGGENQLPAGTEVIAFRYKSGEDASCNNLYQSTQPRALGVPPQMIETFSSKDRSFAWAGSLAESDDQRANPWELLGEATPHAGTETDPIPVVIDKNTANYSLKIYTLGSVREVRYDSGETFHFKVVGFLANTILQGSLLMSERDFSSMFPTIGGYEFFLIADAEDSAESSRSTVEVLEDRLSDQGFDAKSAPQLLAGYMSVQNTYLSTFQTLGGLGLLLGTFGLAAVQIRSVLERKGELGLLRAVGYELPKLSRMVMLENAWLLMAGLVVGVGSALFTTIPHWLVGTASIPWGTLGLTFGFIVLVGLAAGWLASRNLGKLPLLEALRS